MTVDPDDLHAAKPKTRTPDPLLRPLRQAMIIAVALANGGAQSPAEVRKQPRTRVGRNQPCPCGSGSKFKRCCGRGN